MLLCTRMFPFEQKFCRHFMLLYCSRFKETNLKFQNKIFSLGVNLYLGSRRAKYPFSHNDKSYHAILTRTLLKISGRSTGRKNGFLSPTPFSPLMYSWADGIGHNSNFFAFNIKICWIKLTNCWTLLKTFEINDRRSPCLGSLFQTIFPEIPVLAVHLSPLL